MLVADYSQAESISLRRQGVVEFFVSHLLPVQADMLSACLEYEDMLSDKLRGAHPDPFFDKRSDFVDYPSKARLPVAFPKGMGPCSFVLLSENEGGEPTPTLPKGGGHVLLSFCLMSFCPSVSCFSVLLSHVFLSFCLKKSFCLILKNIKISLLVFSVTLRSITFATDKEHQLRLKK